MWRRRRRTDSLIKKYPFLKIKYTIVKFTLAFTADTEVVREKASALRGGIGDMLLDANCVAERDCETCVFQKECIVQRIMYSYMENKPKYMQNGDGVGYIVSCRDKRTKFFAGDELEFQIYLFGKNIIYFSQYINAVYALGKYGFGKNKSHFVISRVENLYGNSILEGTNIYMKNYRWQTLEKYVSYRLEKLCNGGENTYNVQALSPLALKYNGELVGDFVPEAMRAALLRRLQILSCFDEIGIDFYQPASHFPVLCTNAVRDVRVPRYSNRKQQHITLRGVEGSFEISNVTEEWLVIFLAGEILHIGKNTSFGFGRLRVSQNDE